MGVQRFSLGFRLAKLRWATIGSPWRAQPNRELHRARADDAANCDVIQGKFGIALIRNVFFAPHGRTASLSDVEAWQAEVREFTAAKRFLSAAMSETRQMPTTPPLLLFSCVWSNVSRSIRF
jgi:hypothetical protein